MCESDEIEAHIRAVRLDYRHLWLDAEHTLAQVELILAEALGVQTGNVHLDALALAEAAAYRLRELDSAVGHREPRQPARSRRQREFA